MDKDSHTVEKTAGEKDAGEKAVGEKADIPLKEFDLLFYLGGMPGKTRTRDQLIEDIWGYDFDGNERTLDVHIGRLRDRFPSAEYGFKITTVRGLGYRLEGGDQMTETGNEIIAALERRYLNLRKKIHYLEAVKSEM
jgi:DNA-binding response OmpR family regulator